MNNKLARVIIFGLCFFLAVPGLFAVGQQEAGDEKHEIATVVKITGIPWFNRLEEGVKEAGELLFVNSYQIGPSDADPAQQVKMVEDLVSKGVDAICITPNDAKALEPAFAKAKAKGIPIITHESPNQIGKDYDIELIDNVQFGRHFWDMMVNYMGDSGQYVIFVGSLTVPLHNLWADEGIKYAEEKYPNLELVTERIPCGEDQELSKQTTLELLKTYPELKGIIGFGSLGPPGAAQALKEKGMDGKVTVVGTVLPDHAATYLKEGSMQHGILWDPKDAGFAMTWIAKQIVDGKSITNGMEIPGIGKVVVEGDVIKVDAVIDITKDNVDSFGF
ncbi:MULTISPECIES: autoinducer 2 ABC transporter substrate-binding protein [unclassified Oceanispirochaeta]|uniref:autoinducer 2 ABC transporter substrate-binding protein n=1 Tax=unclassified Oceanispirochaeta TaxID=2635722 RepID=UPI000E092129|nr:autoinducer 2 ABC transporter substrate-binding protein [Oceanispirochaeta sp. M1]MBF9018547.1 autoinducer 2 ABC transporter substrate-binding protein [Oceanispirochaeta sp. M2]NPD74954.1 autoinducer 2 ABC transporter substrate-binding protein [Oceanispirochaeta sp. M1]RDG29185.1 autoinducer 2 ABC transporter substrate-binding protein [Oceanispirochaeta sp. M1]